jgi:hypothetical protein
VQPGDKSSGVAIQTAERKQRNPLGPIIIGGGSLVGLALTVVILMSVRDGDTDSSDLTAQAPVTQATLESDDAIDPLEAPSGPETSRSLAEPATTSESPKPDADTVVRDEKPEPPTEPPYQPDPDGSEGDPVPPGDTVTIPDIGFAVDSPTSEADAELENNVAMAESPPAIDDCSSPPAEAPEPKEAAVAEESSPKPAEAEASPDSLGPLLQSAWDDLREENYDAADAKLAKTEGMAAAEEHKAMVSRLRLVAKYAREFHDAMRSGYQNLKANSEIEVGTGDTVNVVYVVEIRDDGVVFRVNGRNVRFDGIDEVPFGLAVAIGSKGVGMDGPRTAIRRGAYVATVSDPDDEEAIPKVRAWLESASKYVDDAKRLLDALDDSYDF